MQIYVVVTFARLGGQGSVFYYCRGTQIFGGKNLLLNEYWGGYTRVNLSLTKHILSREKESHQFKQYTKDIDKAFNMV